MKNKNLVYALIAALVAAVAVLAAFMRGRED